MKLAVLADIHSNWRALQAVADHIGKWQPDQVVVAGDVINRGPRPVECLDFVLKMQERGVEVLELRGSNLPFTHFWVKGRFDPFLGRWYIDADGRPRVRALQDPPDL